MAEVERRLSVAGALEAALAANLKRAERLRQSILRRAFAGRLVAQDPADEPAAALLARIGAARADGPQQGGAAKRGRTAQAADGDAAPKKRGRPRTTSEDQMRLKLEQAE